jgi:UDP-glucose 4-epimerase
VPPAARASRGLTVAVTGPTGEIGLPFIAALERSRDVARIVGMARRPFDPAAHGFRRTEYRRGDVLDRAAVEGLADGADVVVHLAFVVLQASDETRHINVEGSRNVFEAAVAAGAKRLVYASSVAAYGFPEATAS